jgi:hypothetical protein
MTVREALQVKFIVEKSSEVNSKIIAFFKDLGL